MTLNIASDHGQTPRAPHVRLELWGSPAVVTVYGRRWPHDKLAVVEGDEAGDGNRVFDLLADLLIASN